MATPAFQAPILNKIVNLIQNEGPLSFHDYMQIALYDEAFGYYSGNLRHFESPVGKNGDFITSVSVGSCFGIILAHRIHQYWIDSGRSQVFNIIEPGAHDGTLCQDILSEIKTLSTELYQATQYHLVERSCSLREMQAGKLSAHTDRYQNHQNLDSLQALHGVIISNELIDAFPVELIQLNNGVWQQLFVHHSDGELQMSPAEITRPELKVFCQSLGYGFPDGYTTEFNPSIEPFIKNIAATLTSGLLITIDYGFTHDELYDPARSSGTLQTYSQHTKADNPLEKPGLQDITSHIDFSRVISAAESHNFELCSYKPQSSYLTTHARAWLLAQESAPTEKTSSLFKQFQTLTHPAMLGNKFMVLEMKKS